MSDNKIQHEDARRREEVVPSKGDAPSPLLIEQALSQLDGDSELLFEVVEVFVDTMPDLLNDLKKASEDADAAAIASLAHSIKGAASNICAEPMRASAAALEQDGRGGHIEGAQAVAIQLCHEFDELKKFVETLG